jgi:predicted nucleic acid-binding protein
VLIAGAASTTGASHILLQLSELTLLQCLASPYVIEEAERNLTAKLPAALPAFQLIVQAAVKVGPVAPPWLARNLIGQAHPKDLPVLAASISGKADFLATFNTRDFSPRKLPPLILQPKDVLARIRRSLARILE